MPDLSFWERTSPGRYDPCRELPAETDVLIVGGGFLGLWLARFLSRSPRPLRVLVLERDLLAAGASTRNAGFLTCGCVSEMEADAARFGLPAVLETFDRRRRGIEIVAAEFGGLTDPCGSADFDGWSESRERLMERLNDAAPAFEVRWLPFGGGERRAFFNRLDRAVHPVRLWRELHGPEVRHGAQVRSIGGGEAEVATVAGRAAVRYRRAFLCTNAFASELDPRSGVLPGRGQVILTDACAGHLPRLLGFHDAGFDYFRVVEGRLLVGGGRQLDPGAEETTAFETTERVLAHLRGLARTILGHDRFAVEARWAGVMGFPGGNHLPAYPRRRIDEATETVAGCGGMGVALAPLVAREIAAEVQEALR